MLTLIRKSKKKEETLVIVCNFSALKYEKYQMGVPYAGKYKEVFNSDGKQFGGTGAGNPRLKSSKKQKRMSVKIRLQLRSHHLQFRFLRLRKRKERKSTEENSSEST